MSASGGNPTRVTFTGTYNISPAISGDGRWLAYISRVGGAFKLHVMELATGNVSAITDTSADESPSFAPNSKLIVYATQLQGREALMTTTLDGKIKARLAGQAGLPGFRGATLAGTVLLPAGRRGGWPGALWLAREPAACAAPVQAVDGAVWDGRWRLAVPCAGRLPAGCSWGALGREGARLRKAGLAAMVLPATVLHGLPALRRGDRLLAVPPLGWAADDVEAAGLSAIWQPARPAGATPLAGCLLDRCTQADAPGDAPGTKTPYVEA